MDMNELLEPFEKMLESVCTPAEVRAVENGGSALAMWDAIHQSGFLDALVPEEVGGAGLSLADIEPLIQALGRHAVPLPVADTMVARRLLADAGQDCPEGPIALAVAVPGQQSVVTFGLVSEHVLLETPKGLMLVAAAVGQPQPTGVRADLSARMQFEVPNGSASLPGIESGLRPVIAVLRAAMMAGAGGKLLEMTVAYANERVQFGKPIGRQQALQQLMAVMAEDMIATRLAAQLGCAGGFPVSFNAAATAKSVASFAAPRIAASAHAVHGAIGVSEEHDLQLFTRRLHEWRMADGSEGYWNRELGAARLASPDCSVDWIRGQIFA